MKNTRHKSYHRRTLFETRSGDDFSRLAKPGFASGVVLTDRHLASREIIDFPRLHPDRMEVRYPLNLPSERRRSTLIRVEIRT